MKVIVIDFIIYLISQNILSIAFYINQHKYRYSAYGSHAYSKNTRSSTSNFNNQHFTQINVTDSNNLTEKLFEFINLLIFNILNGFFGEINGKFLQINNVLQQAIARKQLDKIK